MSLHPVHVAAGGLVVALVAATGVVPSYAGAIAPTYKPAPFEVHHALPRTEQDLTKAVPFADRMAQARELAAAAVESANTAFAASQGKASEDSRRQLAVARNQAQTAADHSTSPSAIEDVAAAVAPAVTTVEDEVAAWEEAERRRKEEEERRRREEERRRSQQHYSSSSGGGSSDSPKAYLNRIASSYGVTINWASNACGRGSSTKVSGCYTGGSTVTVTTAAYKDWGTAKDLGRRVVLHEISHVKITRTCGTVYVGADRFENVTDAYAALIGGGSTGYGYSNADMDLAKAVRDGRCSV